jgi:hypothetical protein
VVTFESLVVGGKLYYGDIATFHLPKALIVGSTVVYLLSTGSVMSFLPNLTSFASTSASLIQSDGEKDVQSPCS